MARFVLRPSPRSAFLPHSARDPSVPVAGSPKHLSEGPILQLTNGLCELYKRCSPEKFRYSSSINPRRVLTKPSEGVSNFRFDNANSDLIAYVGDSLGEEPNRKFVIDDLLGSGTFGQVFKCTDLENRSRVVAVKVVKNKQAYYNQGLVEVRLLEQLNKIPGSHEAIVQLTDYFVYKRHLCLVFEMLSINLYELIKQNSHRGLNITLVRHFTRQILEGLAILEKIQLIHCDVKPENILLVDSKSSKLKLIDFGSACYENQTVYTYIQSRFYRSPEVIVGTPYNSRIDMWSLGCVAAELLLGLPVFPGHSEYDQMCRIVEMLGNPPDAILLRGKSTSKYFLKTYDKLNSQYLFELKSLAQYSVDQGVRQKPGKKYFKYTTLEENVLRYPFNSSLKADALTAEKENRVAFVDFLRGVLNVDYRKRWTPSQALHHPFITGEPFSPSVPFVPPPPVHSLDPSPSAPSRQPPKLTLADLTKGTAQLGPTPAQQTSSYLAMQSLGTSPSTSMMSKMSSMTSSFAVLGLSASAPSTGPMLPTSSQVVSAAKPKPEDSAALLGISPSAGHSSHLRLDPGFVPTAGSILPSSGFAQGLSSVGGGGFGLGQSPSQKSPYFGQHLPPTTQTSPYSSSFRAPKDQTGTKPTSKPDPDEDIFEFE
ncbi:MAG: protein kinase [archaeon]|nr:protein kinase [archaeon]